MNTAEGLALVARVVGGLVIVLVLVAISARIARRSRHFGGNSDLEIVDRLGVSKEAQIAVVRVGERRLLLGISPQGITMLSHLDDATTAFESGAPLDALEQSAEPAAPDVVPAFGSPATAAATVPPLTSAPVTISDLPADVAAELIAHFEAAQPAGFQPAQFQRVAAQEQEAQQIEQIKPAEPAEPAEQLRRRRSRHAAPIAEPEPVDTAPAAPEIPEVQLPGAINLGDHPDLASALRAAGRTTRPGATEEAQLGGSSWIPSQRAASDVPDLSHATSSAPVVPTPAEADGPAERRRGGRARRAPLQRSEQANGSVLSPATWRQGIDALREMTVRRG